MVVGTVVVEAVVGSCNIVVVVAGGADVVGSCSLAIMVSVCLESSLD